MVIRFVLFFLLVLSKSFAAAPATHLFFAQMWLDTHPYYATDDRVAFFIGTEFPDIRYLGTISRKQTHEKNVTIEMIKSSSSPFISGMRVHVFLDIKRKSFVAKSHLFDAFTDIPKKNHMFFLKLLEDEIYWNRIDTQLILNSLPTTLIEEVEQGVDKETVEKWHLSLMKYFKQKPSTYLKILSENGEGFLSVDAETIKCWAEVLPIYAKKQIFVKYSENLVDYMKVQFSESP